VEELVVIPFDRAFSSKSAEDFVAEVLVGSLEAEVVSVGDNFHFGKGARGTPDFLRSHDEFETRQVPIVEVGGEPVSSTRIRGLVEAGDVKGASALLGGPFLFEAEVAHGDKRGRELGMPTANLVPDPALVCPAHGVYAAWAHGHPAAVNVGVRPTFGQGNALLVEAYLLDFEGDLYGERLRIAFLERLRGEERFDDIDALIAQMGRDVDQTREICAAMRPAL
jgi:riboflavin kinase/FMN adenylyltransferase